MLASRTRLFVIALMAAGLCACSRSSAVAERLDAIAKHANEEAELNGNVLITRGDQVVYEASFGTADASTGVDNKPDTKFMITALSKPFTAVLVLQLVEAGKLVPEAQLSTIFPTLAGKAAGSITIDQLLTHTSGIEELISRDPKRRITVRDLESAKVDPKGFEYSNTGYVCLALVVEVLSGESFEAALNRGIFVPSDMRDSGVLRTGRKVPGLARGHHGMIGLQPEDFDFAPEAVDGAGSIYSTARDLWKFDRTLAANRLLSRAMQQRMYVPHPPGTQGYGWFLQGGNGQFYPWQSGEMAGYSAVMVRMIPREEAIIILGNTAATHARQLQEQFLQVLGAPP